MPVFRLLCDNCRKFIEVRSSYDEAEKKICNCGKKYRIQFSEFSFRIRHGRPDVIQWKKEKGVLDEIP